MMDLLRVSMGMALPWLAGVVWLRYRWPRAPEGAWAVVLGYGYFIGVLLTTFVLRLFAVFGLPLSLLGTAFVLVGLTAVGLWRTWEIPWRGWCSRYHPSVLERVGFVGLLGLLLARYIGLGLELMLRPLYAWDAWATWAPKARVWYELGRFVPFVDWSTWLERGPGEAYTLAAHHYPPTVPLIQTWMCLALGRWEDSLMNVPWLFCAVALGLAFYGQSRLWGASPLPSLLLIYVVLSLPLINTHVALAGNADLWMAAVYGIAAAAFLHWCRSGDPRQGLLSAGLTLACTQIKVPGLVWMFTLAPAFVVAKAKSTKTIVLFAGALAAVAGAILAVGAARGSLPYLGDLELELHHEVFGAFADSYFGQASWHLFWYLWAGVVVCTLPRRLDQRVFRVAATLVMTGLGFIGGVYSLTPRAEFALDYTQLNRATMHMVPMLAFVAFVCLLKEDEQSKEIVR